MDLAKSLLDLAPIWLYNDGMDDFEAFRKKKLAEKSKAKREATKGLYEFKVEEKGKAKGLVSHRQKLKKLSRKDVPKVKGFDSHIAKSTLDPESIEKFEGKKLWGEDLPKVDPGSVKKVKGRTSHVADTKKKASSKSLKKPSGLKRY